MNWVYSRFRGDALMDIRRRMVSLTKQGMREVDAVTEAISQFIREGGEGVYGISETKAEFRLQDLTFQQLVIDHSTRFEPEVVELAKAQLAKWKQ
jgi:hypothetical protein